MTQRIYVDRSRYETAQRCNRARWYEYHQNQTGIVSARKPLPLAVGSSVHVGLARMLVAGQRAVDLAGSVNAIQREMWRNIEEAAVRAALADFAQYEKAIEPPDAESAILATIGNPTTVFGDAAGADSVAVANVRNEFDEYLFREQSALVEALVRAYARRRLLPLLEQFEVLEVEREGEWKLAEYVSQVELDSLLWFMSRPDALLRERDSNQLYLLSYKTTGAWDLRKARDAEHDMQGMSEGIEIERRLAEWWNLVKHHGVEYRGKSTVEILTSQQPWTDNEAWSNAATEGLTPSMYTYLSALDAPPRILAVRYEYLLKGERWKDKELSARFGCEMRSQKSHLIRAYEAVSVPMRGSAGFIPGDRCWSWEYTREDGREGKLAWQNWEARALWENGPDAICKWIDALDDAAETMSGEDSTMGLAPRLLGYKCDAQAVGLTAQHPLDAVFISPITIYRNEDELRDLVDQMEAQERRIAEGVAAVNAAADEGERRHLLNVHFVQSRHACEYPTTCQFSKVCFGSEDMRRDPLASGLYVARKPNHPQEGSNGNE